MKSLFILSFSFNISRPTLLDKSDEGTHLFDHYEGSLWHRIQAPFNHADVHFKGQRANEEKSMPDRNMAAYSSTLNSRPAETYKPPLSTQPYSPSSQPPYDIFESRLNRNCEHASAQPEP